MRHRPHPHIFLSLLILLAALLTFTSPPLYAAGKPGNAYVEQGDDTPRLNSTVQSIQIVFAKDGTESKIWLRICADAPHFQMRAENVGQWTTEIFHRTEKANGCSPSDSGWYKMVYGIDTGSTSTFRIYATANDGILPEAAFMQRAASFDCRLTGHGTGYCTANNPSAPAGSIDEPSAGQTVQGNSVTVRGWAIDSAALNGTAITEVKVKVNGVDVGTAIYGEPRTDIAGAYNDARYGNSGYRLSFDSRQFANGPANVQVTYGTIISGLSHTLTTQVVINNPPPDANHADTKLRATIENGTTTILLQLCGKGQNYRFRSLNLATSQILFDQAYGALNGCSPEYRAVVNAELNSTFRFTSSVSNGALSETDFAQRRRDSCRIMAAGVIQCSVGDQAPLAPPAVPIPQFVPPPLPACAVPFFSQVDPTWKNNKIGNCSTIGGVGCGLTSVAMIYRYYGADTNPGTLNSCMGSKSCPMLWGQNPAGCSNGKVTFMKSESVRKSEAFAWERLDREVGQKGRPVIIGLNRPCRYSSGTCGHYVVVVSGSGNNAANYRIHDPGVRYGANGLLSNYTKRGEDWVMNQLITFDGPNPASCLTTAVQEPAPITEMLDGKTRLGTIANRAMPHTHDTWALSASNQLAAVTGTAEVIRLEDEARVILELTAQSDAGITEMQIASDTAPNEIWQPFTPYVIATAGDVVTVRFKNAAGTISDPIQAITTPEQAEPLSIDTYTLYLPLTIH